MLFEHPCYFCVRGSQELQSRALQECSGGHFERLIIMYPCERHRRSTNEVRPKGVQSGTCLYRKRIPP